MRIRRPIFYSFHRSTGSATKRHLDGDEGRPVEDGQRHRKAIDGGAEQLQDLSDALPQRQPRRTVGQVQRHLADRAKVATTGQKEASAIGYLDNGYSMLSRELPN